MTGRMWRYVAVIILKRKCSGRDGEKGGRFRWVRGFVEKFSESSACLFVDPQKCGYHNSRLLKEDFDGRMQKTVRGHASEVADRVKPPHVVASKATTRPLIAGPAIVLRRHEFGREGTGFRRRLTPRMTVVDRRQGNPWLPFDDSTADGGHGAVDSR